VVLKIYLTVTELVRRGLEPLRADLDDRKRPLEFQL